MLKSSARERRGGECGVKGRGGKGKREGRGGREEKEGEERKGDEAHLVST